MAARALVLALAAALLGAATPTSAAQGACPAGRVALTFDDGPQPGVTDLVLDTLAARDVRATFFVIGGLAATHPELVARTAAEGHVIGNHSWAHEVFTGRTNAQIRQSIVQTNETVQAAAGGTPALVRPPYGATNDRVAGVIAELGLVQKMWSVSSGDTTGIPPEQIAHNVLAGLRPRAVVLQHDNLGSGHRTAAALPAIIDGARERGHCFGVLDDTGAVVASRAHPPQHADRISGATRYHTAVALSQTGWPDGAPGVVLVTGQRFPDGLAAAALAGALGGPVLLAPEGHLPDIVGDELTRLRPHEALLVGPLGDAVADAVAERGIDVGRIRGENRYETAELIAETATARGADGTTVLLASGADFPDALSASALAAAGPHPILLTFSRDDPARVDDAVRRVGAERVLVAGGPGVVPDALIAGLPDVERLAGPERVATAAAVARHARALGLDAPPLLASAATFPDALAAGPLAGAVRGAPLLLTAPRQLSPPLAAWLASDDPGRVTIVGGAAAVDARVACLLEEGFVPSFRCQ